MGTQHEDYQEIPLRLMNEVIESDYETVKQKSRIASWARLKEICQQESVPDPQLRYLLPCGAQQESNQADSEEAGASCRVSAWALLRGTGTEDAASRRPAV